MCAGLRRQLSNIWSNSHFSLYWKLSATWKVLTCNVNWFSMFVQCNQRYSQCRHPLEREIGTGWWMMAAEKFAQVASSWVRSRLQSVKWQLFSLHIHNTSSSSQHRVNRYCNSLYNSNFIFISQSRQKNQFFVSFSHSRIVDSHNFSTSASLFLRMST